jgi:thiamine biosynthesis lipoprotein
MEEMKYRVLPVFLLLALVLLASSALQAGGGANVRHEESRMVMGTMYTVTAYGPNTPKYPDLISQALDEVERIDKLLSHYKPDSQVSKINLGGSQGPVVVDQELFDLIAESVRYSRDFDGAFDITVGPLVKTWGFFLGKGKLPADAELETIKPRVGYQHIILDAAAHSVRFDVTGAELDLSGIGHGYAVDRAVRILRAGGAENALVSAGGTTVYAMGAPLGSNGWPVDIPDPIDPKKPARKVMLRDRALSVSGSAVKAFEAGGVRYSHIMDPRTLKPVQGILSVAVLTTTGTIGDALDNVFFVQGVDLTRSSLTKHPAGTEAMFFLPDAADPTKWTMVSVK